MRKQNAWIVVLSAGLFFFYEFIQQNMFDAISGPLIQAFHVDAASLGKLSSLYYIATVVFLFPAGILLDRFATRKVILTSLGFCVFGTIGLALSHTLLLASISRFFTGIGSAFCFLSVLRLASRWFPPHKMAFVSGVVVTLAMTGGMVAQTPLTALVAHVGWRISLLYDAGLGFLIWLIITFIVKDYPDGHEQTHQQEQQQIAALPFWRSLTMAFAQVQNWLSGIYTCLMNLPVGILGGLWGVMFLVGVHHLSKIDASYITSALFFGSILGCPAAGWVSDHWLRRKPPMIVGAILSLALVAVIIWTPNLSFTSLLFLFMALGFITSTQIISYALVAERSPRVVTAMSVSVVNISVMGGTGLLQPIFGYFMDIHQFKRLHHYATAFVASDYHWAMMMLPIGFVIALLAALLLRETYGRAVAED